MTEIDAGTLGVVPLTRFAVRRDRVRIAIWIASIALVVVATVGSIRGLYPHQSDLEAAARASRDNAAAIIFNGPPQGLDTVGGQVAFQTGTFGLILMGLMSTFVLGRMTRGEEESGRIELVRALPVGPWAPDAAALITVGAMNVATGALVVLSLVALGLPTLGSVVFGVSFALFGLFMAACTLLVAQVTENTRVVYGVGGIVLGAAFLLRAMGDVGNGTLSWASPIGWAQKARPFAGNLWWPFLVIVIATAALTQAAVKLSRRRDLGSGLVTARPGPARASPSTGTLLGLAARLQRGSLLGWTAGMVVLAGAYGSITDSVHDFVKDNPTLADIIATRGHGTIVEQYLAMSFRVLALVSAGFAIQSALRMRSEEIAGRAEGILATPQSRVRWATTHLRFTFGGALCVLALIGLAFGGSDAAVSGDLGAIGRSVAGMVAYTPAVWVLAGVTVALIGVVPRASPAAWGALGACFVIGMFGQLLELPVWLRDLSPFEHVTDYPATNVDGWPLVALLVVAAGLTALGLFALRRRDLG